MLAARGGRHVCGLRSRVSHPGHRVSCVSRAWQRRVAGRHQLGQDEVQAELNGEWQQQQRQRPRPRLVTDSCVSVRQTISTVVHGRGLGREFICLLVCRAYRYSHLSIFKGPSPSCGPSVWRCAMGSWRPSPFTNDWGPRLNNL